MAEEKAFQKLRTELGSSLACLGSCKTRDVDASWWWREIKAERGDGLDLGVPSLPYYEE